MKPKKAKQHEVLRWKNEQTGHFAHKTAAVPLPQNYSMVNTVFCKSNAVHNTRYRTCFSFLLTIEAKNNETEAAFTEQTSHSAPFSH
jgi:hypothetical protein